MDLAFNFIGCKSGLRSDSETRNGTARLDLMQHACINVSAYCTRLADVLPEVAPTESATWDVARYTIAHVKQQCSSHHIGFMAEGLV